MADELLRVVETKIDIDADAAYLKFNNDGPVAQTVPYSERVFVDLDKDNTAVGVEIVSLSDTWFDCVDFCRRFRLEPAVADDMWRAHMNAGLGNRNPYTAKEFRALSSVLDGLESLDARRQVRVLRRVFDRLDDQQKR